MRVAFDASAAVAVTDELQCPQHRAAMIPVAVTEHDGLHRAEVDGQPGNVLLEGAVFRAGVEEHRARGVASPQREQAGPSVRGAAQAGAAQHPGTAAPPSQAGEFGFHERRDGRQRVGDVVDENLDFDGVDGREGDHVAHDSA